ncbi:unnamed protein product [Heligmosomoides polygyrus]|uniref:Uncharacterized protein n=1 Tax=Heligmosomoides polygyrus TaxID=6339 RepID=A0A183FZ81_HELPZ|nr:unnamed protein product [Heligmosomoides polygyrus]
MKQRQGHAADCGRQTFAERRDGDGGSALSWPSVLVIVATISGSRDAGAADVERCGAWEFHALTEESLLAAVQLKHRGYRYDL